MPTSGASLSRRWAAVCATSLLLVTSPALAQTWLAARTTPSITELVVVDATGEPTWPYGAEDVAGDGLGAFTGAEQAVDFRSTYAATDNARLWIRAYVSATAAPSAGLRLYVFMDSDGDPATGGSAAATALEPEFTSDPSGGGYEHVLGLGGDGTVLGFWDYRAQQDDFAANAGGAARATAEADTDLDPLRLNADTHGYVQGAIELGAIEFTAACDGRLFLRSVSDQGSDLGIGLGVDCNAPDSNNNGVPNAVEVVAECQADADCPAGAVCISGTCRYPTACTADTDCAANETCVDGRCVASGGQGCMSNADCDGLVCVNGSCEACGTSASCASGQACGPDGRCVAGTSGGSAGSGSKALIDPDEKLQGGALTCTFGRQASGSPALVGLGLVVYSLRRRRRR